MDRVRFGRALGYGARHAARTLAEAARAASTPSPPSPGRTTARSSPAAPSSGRAADGSATALQETGSDLLNAHRSVAQATAQVRTGTVAAGRSMLTPVRRAGSVLWLEMTGTAFALFSLFLAPGLWKLRGAIHASPSSSEARKLYLYAVVLALFTYFAISSFVRAHRRGKQ